MITLNKSEDLIVGSIWGENFSVPYSEKRFKKMKSLYEEASEASTKNELDGIIEDFRSLTVISTRDSVATRIPDLLYSEDRNQYFLQTDDDGSIIISSIPLPKALIEKILEADDRGFDTQPMIKFWIRLLRNPLIVERKNAIAFANLVCNYVMKTFVDRKLEQKLIEEGLGELVAKERATFQQTPFTTEGLISTKKVVAHKFDISQYEWKLVDGNKKLVLKGGMEKEIDPITGEEIEKEVLFIAENQVYAPYIHQNGDNFFCGDKLGYIYQVGKEARLPNWSMVNTNSRQSCSKGLHTGNQDYINGYEREHNTTLNCFVDPMDIGAVPDNEDVLRVLAFFPHSIKDREDANKQYYMSSHYAAITDARWAEYKKEAIKKFEADKNEILSKASKDVADLDQHLSELDI